MFGRRWNRPEKSVKKLQVSHKVTICEHSTIERERLFEYIAICTKNNKKTWHIYLLNLKKILRRGKKVHKKVLFFISFVNLTMGLSIC